MCPCSQPIALCESAELRIGFFHQNTGVLLTEIELSMGNHRISIRPVWNIRQRVHPANTFHTNALHCLKYPAISQTEAPACRIRGDNVKHDDQTKA